MSRLGGLAIPLVAAVVVAGAAAAPRETAVTLTVDTLTPPVGASIRLTARVPKLPRGYSLLIQFARPGGVVKVAQCRAKICTGRWTETAETAVTFQALLLRPGRHVAARSRRVAVRWRIPPPAAAVGHYCGFTNEGKSICFDLGADQRVVNLRTESIVTCPDLSKWLWTIGFSLTDPLQQLAFSYPYSGPLNAPPGDANVTATYLLTGTFDTSGNASGTIALSHIAWDASGMHYECVGEPRTWTARLGA